MKFFQSRKFGILIFCCICFDVLSTIYVREIELRNHEGYLTLLMSPGGFIPKDSTVYSTYFIPFLLLVSSICALVKKYQSILVGMALSLVLVLHFTERIVHVIINYNSIFAYNPFYQTLISGDYNLVNLIYYGFSLICSFRVFRFIESISLLLYSSTSFYYLFYYTKK
jgi:hypothetical protein